MTTPLRLLVAAAALAAAAGGAHSGWLKFAQRADRPRWRYSHGLSWLTPYELYLTHGYNLRDPKTLKMVADWRDDTHRLSPPITADAGWSQLATEDVPHARYGHSFVRLGEALVLFAGDDGGRRGSSGSTTAGYAWGSYNSDVWALRRDARKGCTAGSKDDGKPCNADMVWHPVVPPTGVAGRAADAWPQSRSLHACVAVPIIARLRDEDEARPKAPLAPTRQRQPPQRAAARPTSIVPLPDSIVVEGMLCYGGLTAAASASGGQHTVQGAASSHVADSGELWLMTLQTSAGGEGFGAGATTPTNIQAGNGNGGGGAAAASNLPPLTAKWQLLRHLSSEEAGSERRAPAAKQPPVGKQRPANSQPAESKRMRPSRTAPAPPPRHGHSMAYHSRVVHVRRRADASGGGGGRDDDGASRGGDAAVDDGEDDEVETFIEHSVYLFGGVANDCDVKAVTAAGLSVAAEAATAADGTGDGIGTASSGGGEVLVRRRKRGAASTAQNNNALRGAGGALPADAEADGGGQPPAVSVQSTAAEAVSCHFADTWRLVWRTPAADFAAAVANTAQWREAVQRRRAARCASSSSNGGARSGAAAPACDAAYAASPGDTVGSAFAGWLHADAYTADLFDAALPGDDLGNDAASRWARPQWRKITFGIPADHAAALRDVPGALALGAAASRNPLVAFISSWFKPPQAGGSGRGGTPRHLLSAPQASTANRVGDAAPALAGAGSAKQQNSMATEDSVPQLARRSPSATGTSVLVEWLAARGVAADAGDSAVHPSPRSLAAVGTLLDGLLLHGGALCNPGCTCFGDTWRLAVSPSIMEDEEEEEVGEEGGVDSGDGGLSGESSTAATHIEHAAFLGIAWTRPEQPRATLRVRLTMPEAVIGAGTGSGAGGLRNQSIRSSTSLMTASRAVVAPSHPLQPLSALRDGGAQLAMWLHAAANRPLMLNGVASRLPVTVVIGNDAPSARYRHAIASDYRYQLLNTLQRAAAVTGQPLGGLPTSTLRPIAILFGGESYTPPAYHDDTWMFVSADGASAAHAGDAAAQSPFALALAKLQGVAGGSTTGDDDGADADPPADPGAAGAEGAAGSGGGGHASGASGQLHAAQHDALHRPREIVGVVEILDAHSGHNLMQQSFVVLVAAMLAICAIAGTRIRVHIQRALFGGMPPVVAFQPLSYRHKRHDR